MTVSVWGLFIVTVLIMMSTPGPSHLLMLSTSASNGFKRSLATAAGDLSANAIQMLLAGFGLAAILSATRYGFEIIKWAGVAYLIWMGCRTLYISFRADKEQVRVKRASLKRLWLRGFITSAANPKAVVFFAALFPQFINPEHAILPQVLILGATYIFIDGAFLAAYGRGASWLSAKLAAGYKNWVDRFAGIGLIGAAVLLGLKSTSKS